MRAPTSRVFAAIGAALAGLTTACADAPTGPAPAGGPALATTSVSTTTVSTSGTSSSSVTVSSSSSGTAGDTSKVVLSVSPTTTATFTIGQHKVQLVAGSICDPNTAGYGPTLWDAPCKPATATVKITAKAWTTSSGHPKITFSPDVRFVPGKVNTIWLLDRNAAAQKLGVLAWCPTGGPACVDESLTDPSLVTQYTTDGYAYRRLKHFSGFEVVW